MSESIGKVKISNEALASIAGIAATEIDGVSAIAKSFGKNVKAVVDNNEIHVDVPIVVKADYNIPDVSKKAQERVKTVLESMTGLTVPEVNVRVEGVSVS